MTRLVRTQLAARRLTTLSAIWVIASPQLAQCAIGGIGSGVRGTWQ